MIEVPALKEAELTQATQSESSSTIQARVESARNTQLKRQDKPNAALGNLEIEQHCALDEASQSLLKTAISKFNLSARAYHRILKVARTIADLSSSANIETAHIAEAVQYRKSE